jgi:hypothetical protein
MKTRRRRHQDQEDLLRSRVPLPRWRELPQSCRTQLVALLMELLDQHAKTAAVTEARGGSDE